VTAGEDERQPLVGDGAQLVLVLGQFGKALEELGLPRQGAVSANPVDRAVPRRRDDPRARIPGGTLIRPALQRDRTAPLLAEDGCDVR
jgi:hypothetical protein